ncbi:hypothetical protein THAOC_13181 [Thalassiosira oceanica]|uniref:Uncharacterized protein n=1 Tax=Thalassiosira oceanica TaxID=159749 RepID=K0SKR2_THAOC|nr:hypothetical protein THAOC_13181 [Thalassiosira oceanica]|eukprot:EJK65920.1 hypothetical protein THAOC_13181 [Thalassiosira oceanica]
MKFFTLVSVLAFVLESGAEVTSLRGNSISSTDSSHYSHGQLASSLQSFLRVRQFEEQAHEASLTEVRETSSDALCLNYCRPVKPNSNSHRDWRRWQEEGRKSWGGHWGGGGNDWRKWQNPENWGGGRHSWGGHGGWGGGRNTCNRSHCTCCGATRRSPSYRVGRSAVCVAGFCSSEEEVEYFETFLQAVKDESLGGLCNESSCTCCNPIGSHYEVAPGSYCPVGFCDSDEEVDDFEDLMEAVEDSLAQHKLVSSSNDGTTRTFLFHSIGKMNIVRSRHETEGFVAAGQSHPAATRPTSRRRKHPGELPGIATLLGTGGSSPRSNVHARKWVGFPRAHEVLARPRARMRVWSEGRSSGVTATTGSVAGMPERPPWTFLLPPFDQTCVGAHPVPPPI